MKYYLMTAQDKFDSTCSKSNLEGAVEFHQLIPSSDAKLKKDSQTIPDSCIADILGFWFENGLVISKPERKRLFLTHLFFKETNELFWIPNP